MNSLVGGPFIKTDKKHDMDVDMETKNHDFFCCGSAIVSGLFIG